MKTAWVAIREAPTYRRDAFCSGLRACGYEVRFDEPRSVDSETIYCIWNRYHSWHDTAKYVESAGGRVVVCENGYINGPRDGGLYYAMALSGHNGSGTWPTGDSSRWDALGIDLKPWRTDGGHILVAVNRTFGAPNIAMPPEWPAKVKRRLGEVTKREIRVRPHPGNDAPRVPLERDLENCYAVVVWASSVGVWSLIEGIPTIACSPFWIMKAAAGALEQVETPLMPDRLPAFQRLAFAQWDIPSIQSGEAFRHLLNREAAA